MQDIIAAGPLIQSALMLNHILRKTKAFEGFLSLELKYLCILWDIMLFILIYICVMFVIRILRLYNSHHHIKTVQNSSKGIWFWCERTTEHGLFMGGSVIMDLFITNMQLFASWYINLWTGVMWITCGSLWCSYQLFEFSFWWHPFTASYHWWANAKFHSVLRKKQTHLHLGWAEGKYIFSKFSFLGELSF